MKKTIKKKYAPGTKRQKILDTALKFILDPRAGTQNSKHAFLVEEIGLTETEYLEVLNKATNGGLVEAAWN